MPESRVTIKIPRPLYERILKSIEGSGFSSATDFIVYVLRDVMSGAGEKPQLPVTRVVMPCRRRGARIWSWSGRGRIQSE